MWAVLSDIHGNRQAPDSEVAVTIAVIIAAITQFQFRVIGRRVEY